MARGKTILSFGGKIGSGPQTITGTLTVGGQILAADGSAAAPSYSFGSDSDSGMYWSGAGVTFGVNNGSKMSLGQFQATFNTALDVPGGILTTKASASGGAGFRMAHGAAPSAPTNGDMWTTTGGLFVQINGVTKTVTLT